MSPLLDPYIISSTVTFSSNNTFYKMILDNNYYYDYSGTYNLIGPNTIEKVYSDGTTQNHTITELDGKTLVLTKGQYVITYKN